jgi:BlaI family penicillinase repressor
LCIFKLKNGILKEFSQKQHFFVGAFYKCSKITSTIVEGVKVMKLTKAEWQIMNALWQDNPATARELMERLPSCIDWAYTTIKTMLNRLVDKKDVTEQKNGNTSFYKPLVSQRKARSSAFKSLLDQAFNGATGPLVHFLLEEQKLSKRQRQEILNVLQEEIKD